MNPSAGPSTPIQKAFVEHEKAYGKDLVHNLEELSKGLGAGQHFIVKEGRLYTKEHKKFCDKIKYFFQKKQNEKNVKQTITKTVTLISTPMTLRTGEKVNLSETAQDQARKLFFEKMSTLSTRIFDRKAINKEFLEVLEPKLVNTKRTKEEKKAEKEKKVPQEEVNQRKLDRRIEKVRLANRLGIQLRAISQGTSGSYFGVDHKGKILGVYKPGTEESLGSTSPKLKARITYLFMKHVLKIDTAAPFWANEGYIAEVMTTKLAEHLKIGVVPASKATTLRDKSAKNAKGEERGSFQIFAKKTKSADEVLKLHSQGIFGNLILKLRTWSTQGKSEISAAISQKQFEELAVIDYAICNRDRHFENILMREKNGDEATSSGKATHDIFAIDQQLAMPKSNPPKSDKLYRRNQYKWEVFPQANKLFSGEMIANAYTNFRGENLEKLLKSMSAVKSQEKGYNNEVKAFNAPVDLENTMTQELAFKQRIAVLLVCMGSNLTMRDLAAIKSQEEIEEFLKKHDLLELNKLDAFLRL